MKKKDDEVQKAIDERFGKLEKYKKRPHVIEHDERFSERDYWDWVNDHASEYGFGWEPINANPDKIADEIYTDSTNYEKHFAERALEAMGVLSKKEQKALACLYKGYSQQESARIMKISDTSFRSLLRVARSKVKNYLHK